MLVDALFAMMLVGFFLGMNLSAAAFACRAIADATVSQQLATEVAVARQFAYEMCDRRRALARELSPPLVSKQATLSCDRHESSSFQTLSCKIEIDGKLPLSAADFIESLRIRIICP